MLKKSKYAVNATPIHISDNMSAKLDGIPSISTPCTCNPFCKARMNNPELICHYCFAANTISHYHTTLKPALEDNFKLLTTRLLEDDELPIFKTEENAPRSTVTNKCDKIRIESFGDCYNVTQARNYIRIAKANPTKRFGFWSKNYAIVRKAQELEGKPSNVVFIASSPKLNAPIELPEGFDKVFTVYTKEYIKEHNIDINCGAKSCLGCGLCYDLLNGVTEIREEVK